MVLDKELRWMKRLLISGLLGTGVGFGGWYLKHSADVTPRYRTEIVSRGSVSKVVTASGQLNPMVKVEVGSQISGIVQEVFVDFDSQVKAGQVIAQLDPSAHEANVDEADAALANARASLELARANSGRAEVMRAETLMAKADYEKALADLHQAEAAVKMNEAGLVRAKVDLVHCTIRAPIDGVVISRNVTLGQTVAASLSAPTLFVLAQDLRKMRIEANVSEADIGSIEVGQEANFTVDAFPDETFKGKVAQIRTAPTVEQNVVTYPAIIEVHNPALKLKPGMTANVSIVVARRENTLRVPNAALRFRAPAGPGVRKAAPTLAPVGAVSEKGRGVGGAARKQGSREFVRTVYILTSRSESVTGSGDDRLQRLRIRTGLSDGRYTEVVEGLNEGDKVVTGLGIAQGDRRRNSSPLLGSVKKT